MDPLIESRFLVQSTLIVTAPLSENASNTQTDTYTTRLMQSVTDRNQTRLRQKDTSVSRARTQAAALQQWYPVMPSSTGRSPDPRFCCARALLKTFEHMLSHMRANSRLLAGSTAPLPLLITWQSLFHFRKRCVLVLVPGAPGLASSEAWCTRIWHAMVPTLRDAPVDEYSRCCMRSTDSPQQ